MQANIKSEQKTNISTRRKCVNLSASEKLTILNRLKEEESLTKLAAEYILTEKTI